MSIRQLCRIESTLQLTLQFGNALKKNTSEYIISPHLIQSYKLISRSYELILNADDYDSKTINIKSKSLLDFLLPRHTTPLFMSSA